MSRYRSYHGSSFGAGNITGEPRRYALEPGIPGFVKFFDPYVYREAVSFASEEEATRFYITKLREQVQYEGPDSIAAIVMETVTGSNGIIIPPKGYLPGVRKICDDYGIMGGFFMKRDAAVEFIRGQLGQYLKNRGISTSDSFPCLNPLHDDLEKAYDSTLNKVNDREVVDGTVIAMNKREVVVNIGYKSDGIIPLNEFRYNPDLKVGDSVEVYIESQEDKKGQLVLSHRKARATRSWDRVNAALENEEIIKGYIKCRTKGGMIVDVFGIEAFLPGSQIDVKPIRDYDVFVGKTMEFKVVKINQEFKNVVVSHKALIEAELEQQKKEIISKLEKGQVLEGTVKNITSYGVFIDLGGVDGLIHITDLSWGRVSDPKEVVELDQKLNVVILDFDDEKKRIALGLKQLTPHP